MSENRTARQNEKPRHYNLQAELDLGRIVKFPQTKEDIKAASDEQIVAWWRNLPTGSNAFEEFINRRVCYEFNGRFRQYAFEFAVEDDWS